MPGGSRIENAAVVILALCALAVTGMTARRTFFHQPDTYTPGPPTEIANWESYAMGDMRIGPERAPVTIVEFADFECPYCAQVSPLLDTVLTRHPKDVRLIYRNFPLSRIHPHARAAAIAAECATIQGRFQAYHSLLFQYQDSLAQIGWEGLATRADIPDLRLFNNCLAAELPAPKLRADSLAGIALHLVGTPTILVNRWRLNDAPTEDVLDSLINQELAAARKRAGRTVQ